MSSVSILDRKWQSQLFSYNRVSFSNVIRKIKYKRERNVQTKENHINFLGVIWIFVSGGAVRVVLLSCNTSGYFNFSFDLACD